MDKACLNCKGAIDKMEVYQVCNHCSNYLCLTCWLMFEGKCLNHIDKETNIEWKLINGVL